MSEPYAKLISEIQKDTAEWMLRVLEKGLTLQGAVAEPHCYQPRFGQDDQEIKERIKAIRSKLGHPDPTKATDAIAARPPIAGGEP